MASLITKALLQLITLNGSFCVQGVPGGKVGILGGHSIGRSKQKIVYILCSIQNGFRDRAISLYSSQTRNTPCPLTSFRVH
jgi:hypothetical protein